ncbi:MAG: hypothetical protein CSB55_02105 [Candidatus Cloacimonadota bacterium]|nr:MAG: hypothetical protein CSB55_02105 [Candidatus Cloacimonadota bacterium]
MRNKRIKINNEFYDRFPVKTDILTPEDDMAEVIKKYAGNKLQDGDIIVISESPLAITQGRAVRVEDIKVGFLASFLWRFVAKVPYGVGLRSPYSMQCAIDETGSLKILLAAFIGAAGKLFGKRGWFYLVAGMQAGLIDAASTSPVPPYSECVIKGPKNPRKEAKRISEALGGVKVAVMDINDIGGSWMIGSSRVCKNKIEDIMRDNPQGQGAELTPFCIVRKVK